MHAQDVRFRSGGDDCGATLYRPDEPHDRAVPCVVMANGFSLTRRDGLPSFAERFAAAGLAVLAFDFRHLGDSSGEPRDLVDHRRQRHDFSTALSFASTVEGIDPARVAAWGFSLGGGLAIQAAADDRQLAAAVALFPMVDGLAFALGGDPVVGARLIAASARDRIQRDDVRVPVVGPPGSLAVFSQPAALHALDEVIGNDSLWRNEVCARPFLNSSFFRPVRISSKVSCPLMVCLAENDTLVPLKPIAQVAKRAPRGELHRYASDHFDPLGISAVFAQVVADQTEFLARHLSKS